MGGFLEREKKRIKSNKTDSVPDVNKIREQITYEITNTAALFVPTWAHYSETDHQESDNFASLFPREGLPECKTQRFLNVFFTLKFFILVLTCF